MQELETSKAHSEKGDISSKNEEIDLYGINSKREKA